MSVKKISRAKSGTEKMPPLLEKESPSPHSQLEKDREDLQNKVFSSFQSFFTKKNCEEASGLETLGNKVFLNSLQDVQYAHTIPGFEHVLHIFHQEWFGIRAAAGALPGQKLAITADHPLTSKDVQDIVAGIQKIAPKRIIVHAISSNMQQLIRELARNFFHDRLYLVFHGAPTQWSDNIERSLAFSVIHLAQEGKIKKLQFMRPGFDFPGIPLFKPMLFNLSPNLAPDFWREKSPSIAENVAFIPGWSGWIKNGFTNALGAALSPRIKQIKAYSKALCLPSPLHAKIRIISYKNRETTLKLMQKMGVVLNVSLTDCHPIVNTEAQLLGCPCIRGNLALDALEDHPYIQLVKVTDPTSPTEIRDSIEKTLSVPLKERQALTQDYQLKSNQVSINRYKEFLEF